MSDNQQPRSHEDVISFILPPIKTIADEEVVKTITDPNYGPVLAFLRQGPMTVKELTKAYNETAINQGTPKKSSKTMYRYLKHLEKAGLVTQAGKRVTFGKTATETLFSRTAQMFHFRDFAPEWWDSELSLKFSQGVAAAIEQLYDGSTPDATCIRELIHEFENEKELKIHEFVTKDGGKALNLIATSQFTQIEMALQYIGIFSVLLRDPGIIDKLRECFK